MTSPAEVVQNTSHMKSTYYETGDVLCIRLSPEPVAREVAQGGSGYLGYADDGSLAELVLLNAKARGMLPPQVKLPLATAPYTWHGLMDAWKQQAAQAGPAEAPRETEAMRTLYFEDGDILYVLLSDKPVQREAAQEGHTSIGFAADGTIAKVFCLNARRQVWPV